MADVRTCDLCGAEGATHIEVGINVWDAVRTDSPTGTTEGLDACDEHRGEAITRLFKHTRELFDEQLPLHRQINALYLTMDELQAQARETAAPLLRHAEQYAGSPAPPPPPDALATAHKAAVLALAEAEDERRSLVAQATSLHDARYTEFHEGLTAKPKQS